MIVLHALRTYRELFVVLATTLAALFVWHRWAPDVHAFTGEESIAKERLDTAVIVAEMAQAEVRPFLYFQF